MTIPTIVAIACAYYAASTLLKLCLVFFWDRKSFIASLPVDQYYHDTVMAEADLIFAFIVFPILPELYYLWAKTLGRNYISKCNQGR